MSLTVPQLQSYATTFANQNGVPPELFLAQIGQESGWNVYARNGNATGIAQFMPATAAQLGVDLGSGDQQVLSQLQGAAIYDAQLYKQTGSWVDAMQSYGTTAPVNGKTTSAQNNIAWVAQQFDMGVPASQIVTDTNTPVGSSPEEAKAIQQSGASPSWLETHLGNYGLILFGAVLAAGALFFSQRENVTKIVSTVGKVAAVAA